MTEIKQWDRMAARRIQAVEQEHKMIDQAVRRAHRSEPTFVDDADCDFEAPPAEQCPACGGEAFAGGCLGKLTHYNCRQCGWWFHKECV